MSSRLPEVRIMGVAPHIHDELKVIAKEKEGITLSNFLKPKLREIIEDYYTKHPERRTGT